MNKVTPKPLPTWETLAESGRIADAVVEFVRELDYVTFVELNREGDANWWIACSAAREGKYWTRLLAVPSTRRGLDQQVLPACRLPERARKPRQHLT